VSSLRPRTVLAAAWLFMIVYAFPGYMNWDNGDQLLQIRRGELTDWHPPLMASYWWVLERGVRGPLLMLLLQSTCFLWGLHGLLRQRLDERAAAWVAAGIYLFPPVFTPMGAIWKDAQMAGFLVAGVALALRSSWQARIGGLLLLVLAAGVRDNAAAALPHLLLWIAASWGCRRWIVKCAVGAGAFVLVVGTAMSANRAVTDVRMHAWYWSVAPFDMAGTIAHADTISDAELLTVLADTGIYPDVRDNIQARVRRVYTPRVWHPLVFSDEALWITFPDRPQRLARARAWRELIRRYPEAYAAHRWSVTREVLGLSSQPVWEPVCQTFTAVDDHQYRLHHTHTMSWWQQKLGAIYRWLGTTVVYRAWAYLLLASIFLGYGLWRRDQMIVALAGSGLLYEASFVVVTAAPDFRYSHWMVTCTVLCAVLIFRERFQRSSASRVPPASTDANTQATSQCE
jgi:hypothetical protein